MSNTFSSIASCEWFPSNSHVKYKSLNEKSMDLSGSSSSFLVFYSVILIYTNPLAVSKPFYLNQLLEHLGLCYYYRKVSIWKKKKNVCPKRSYMSQNKSRVRLRDIINEPNLTIILHNNYSFPLTMFNLPFLEMFESQILTLNLGQMEKILYHVLERFFGFYFSLQVLII